MTSKFINKILMAALCLIILFGLVVIHTNWFDNRKPETQLISGLSYAPDFYIDEHESQYLAGR